MVGYTTMAKCIASTGSTVKGLTCRCSGYCPGVLLNKLNV